MRTEKIRESRQKKKTRRPAYGRHAAAAVLAGLLAVSFVLAGCRDQSTVVERIAEETEGESLPEETADSMEAAASEQQADSEEKEQDFDPASADAFAAPVKEERVSVQADASGKPKKIEVSGTLSGFSAEDGAFVTDRSDLADQLEAAAAAEPESAQLQALTAWAEPLRRCAEIAALAESAREITRYEDLLQRIRCVQQADLEYGGYTPAQEGQKVSSVFLIETDGTE